MLFQERTFFQIHRLDERVSSDETWNALKTLKHGRMRLTLVDGCLSWPFNQVGTCTTGLWTWVPAESDYIWIQLRTWSTNRTTAHGIAQCVGSYWTSTSPTSLNFSIEFIIFLKTSRKTISRPSFPFSVLWFWSDEACFSRTITSISFRASSLLASENFICCWSSLLRSSVALDQRSSSCLCFYVNDGLPKYDHVDLQGFCAGDTLGNKEIQSIALCYSTADSVHCVGSHQWATNKATDAPFLVTRHSATAKMQDADLNIERIIIESKNTSSSQICMRHVA